MWRFFYHYNKAANSMTVHFRNKCTRVQNVRCKGLDTETKWNDRQPHVVVQGFAKSVSFVKEEDGIVAIIE